MIGTRLRGEDLTRRIIAAAVACGLLALLQTAPMLVVLLVWYGLLVAQLVVLRRTAALGALFIAITLYGTTAWLVAQYEHLFFAPFPSPSIVASTTQEDLAGVLIAYVLVELLIGADRLGVAVRVAAASIRQRVTAPRTPTTDLVVALVLAVVGALDWLRLLTIGIGAVLTGARREYAPQLVLGENHVVQLIVVAATVFIASRAIAGHGRLIAVLVIAFAWSPFLLVGSRKEAIVATVICVLIWAPALNLRRRLVVAAAALAAFLSPAVRTGSITDALHEFILPQYMHFATAMGLVPRDLGGSFAERAWFLVPSAIRPVRIEDFGQAFGALGVTGVGIGASPFGEAALNGFWGSTAWSFAVVFFVAVLAVVLGARRFPAFTVVGFGLLVVYGRSDFWTFVFFAVYIAVVLALLVGPASRLRHGRHEADVDVDGVDLVRRAEPREPVVRPLGSS